MAVLTLLPPTRRPLYTEPFVVLARGGLFAAPWLRRPTPDDLAAVREQSRTLAQNDLSPADLTAALSYLLAVRGHCVEAALATAPAEARSCYQEALRACQTALNLLHHAAGGTAGALASWAQGVHTLVRAQLAMPDLGQTESLAREAAVQLSLIDDPLCEGAEADAHAATLLARDPAELAMRLTDLPDRVADRVAYFRQRIDCKESELNHGLMAVTDAHTRSLVDSVGWGLLNLALMASLPLNGLWRPDIPWSLPLVVAVPMLWWWTWDKPYKQGLRFFDYLRCLKRDSLLAFHQAVEEFPDPHGQYRDSAAHALRQGQADRNRLRDFCLGGLPAEYDRVDEAAVMADEGNVLLTGQWMVELKDRAPWPLAEALPVDPSMLPWSTRIYYGHR